MGIVETFQLAHLAAALSPDIGSILSQPDSLKSLFRDVPSSKQLSTSLDRTWKCANNARRIEQPKPIPQSWERVPFKVGDENLMCMHAPVRGGEDPIYAMLGLKDIVGYNVDYIRLANRMGRPVIVLELPDTENDIGYMDFFREIGENFLITAPPLQHEYRDARRHNMSHSTGGHIELFHLMDEGSAREISLNSVSSTFISPFGTAAFATNKAYNAIYRGYAKVFPNMRYGDTPADRIHALINHMRGHPPLGVRENRLTHRQNTYMVDECSPLIDDIRQKGFPSFAKKRVNSVIIGAKDYVSDFKTNIDVARQLGVEPSIHKEGWHSPHTYRPKARRAIETQMSYAAKNAERPLNTGSGERFDLALESFLSPT